MADLNSCRLLRKYYVYPQKLEESGEALQGPISWEDFVFVLGKLPNRSTLSRRTPVRADIFSLKQNLFSHTR